MYKPTWGIYRNNIIIFNHSEKFDSFHITRNTIPCVTIVLHLKMLVSIFVNNTHRKVSILTLQSLDKYLDYMDFQPDM